MSNRVVVNEPGKCPFCNKETDLTPDNGTIGFQDMHIYVDWCCPFCQEEWTDWYHYENSTYTDTYLGDDD